MSLSILALESYHDRKSFCCGEQALDDYLHKIAKQHLNKGIARTFVLVDEGEPDVILGFMSLSACQIMADTIEHSWKKKYPNNLPAVKLARLAVDRKHQGLGYGALLMVDALYKVVNVAKNLGVVGLFVDAKHDKAKSFYQQYGFLSLPDQLDNLFLQNNTIIDLVEG